MAASITDIKAYISNKLESTISGLPKQVPYNSICEPYVVLSSLIRSISPTKEDLDQAVIDLKKQLIFDSYCLQTPVTSYSIETVADATSIAVFLKKGSSTSYRRYDSFARIQTAIELAESYETVDELVVF